MIKRQNSIVIIVSLIISAGIWIISYSQQDKKKKKHFTTEFFAGSNGWGYDILVDDSLFIRQESIPAASSNKGFSTKEQAAAAATLVVSKLRNGSLPALSKFEIEKICAGVK